MTIDEYEPENDLMEISRKLSSVTIYKVPGEGEHIAKDSLPTIKYLLLSAENEKIKQSARLLRKYLAITSKDESCVNDIIELDILNRLKEIIATNPDEDIKFECSWIVTNIAAGASYQTTAIYKTGFVDVLLSCVSNSRLKFDVKIQAAWALGNIAGDDKPIYREELMKKGFTQIIVDLLEDRYNLIMMNSNYYRRERDQRFYITYTSEVSNIATLIWILTNMSRGGFQVAELYPKYSVMFSQLVKFIIFDNIDIQEQLYHALYRILYNMHEVDPFYDQDLITTTLCSRLAVVLRDGNTKLLWGALKTAINISSAPDRVTIILKHVDVLSYMARVLSPNTPDEYKVDSFLIVSNLSVGNEEMVHYVISHKSVMANVIAHISVPGSVFSPNSYEWIPSLQRFERNYKVDWRITKEAVLTVFNLFASGNDTSIWELMKDHPILLRALDSLLFYKDLPTNICEKVITTLIALIQRSNKWVDTRFTDRKNPYVRELINDGIPTVLPSIQKTYGRLHIRELCSNLGKLLEISELNVGDAKNITAKPDLASVFGLATLEEIKSKSNKRRIIRGMEDGDVRLIENAVGNLCI
ncbi:armadillo-type protein [Pilobolus umbonatus]|nr:armadillo-type protein [Pilobolus umbonatus]